MIGECPKCPRLIASRSASEFRGIDGSGRESIEGHSGRAGREHGDDDPEKLMACRQAGGGKHGSAESEWESEDGVLPLNHFKGNVKVVKNRHRKIVR